MKKFWKTLMFAALGVFALSSCEDVPAPYTIPGGEGGGTGVTELASVDFMQGIGNWTTEDKTSLSGVWTPNAQYGMVGSGYKNSKANAAESWLISPEIDMTEATNVTMILNEAVNKIDAGSVTDQLTVWVSTDDGQNWTEITSTSRPAGTSWTFQDDTFDLTAYDGQKIRLAFKYVSTTESAPSWEIKSIKFNGEGSITIEGGEPVSATEVTCAEAVELTNALDNGGTSTETYSITGYITEVVGSVSRNQQTFWMADTKDGGKVFEAFYANLPEGVTEFTKGAKVKITGQLTKYVNSSGQVTPEIKNATVEILEEGDGGGNETPTTGTEVTCAEAVELTNALADGATSDEVYSITGYITEVVGSVNRNQQTFWMADTKDGGKVFEAFYANLPEGVSAFTVGSKVKITGNLMKYVKDGTVTPEIKNATVEILENGNGEDTPDTPSNPDQTVEGNSITFSNLYANADQPKLDGVSITVGDAVLTFSKGTGSTVPQYYNTGTAARIYGGNTLKISSNKTISKVEFTFATGTDSSNRPYYPTADNASITPSGYDFDTQTWSGNANEIELSYTAKGGHFRLVSLTITYGE